METMKKHNNVLKTFGHRSLSHAAETQQKINRRIHSLVPPNRETNYGKKLKNFQNEMKNSFYNEVSDKIDTMRSNGRQHGT